MNNIVNYIYSLWISVSFLLTNFHSNKSITKYWCIQKQLQQITHIFGLKPQFKPLCSSASCLDIKHGLSLGCHKAESCTEWYFQAQSKNYSRRKEYLEAYFYCYIWSCHHSHIHTPSCSWICRRKSSIFNFPNNSIIAFSSKILPLLAKG